MATISCPKCGTENPDSAINCKQCRINLQFALEHYGEMGNYRETKAINESDKFGSFRYVSTFLSYVLTVGAILVVWMTFIEVSRWWLELPIAQEGLTVTGYLILPIAGCFYGYFVSRGRLVLGAIGGALLSSTVIVLYSILILIGETILDRVPGYSYNGSLVEFAILSGLWGSILGFGIGAVGGLAGSFIYKIRARGNSLENSVLNMHRNREQEAPEGVSRILLIGSTLAVVVCTFIWIILIVSLTPHPKANSVVLTGH